MRWFLPRVSVCVQGDGVGPLGSRMVLGLDGSDGEPLDLNRMEQLLKEIIGGEAIGWKAIGMNRDARVVCVLERDVSAITGFGLWK